MFERVTQGPSLTEVFQEHILIKIRTDVKVKNMPNVQKMKQNY